MGNNWFSIRLGKTKERWDSATMANRVDWRKRGGPGNWKMRRFFAVRRAANSRQIVEIFSNPLASF
jgi:hypothetical protein